MKNLTFAFLLVSVSSAAQVYTVDSLDKKYLNWHNLEPASGNLTGTGADKAWQELLKNRQSKQTVIVAVIDSGIDIDHEDLKENIWVNEAEIPGNNIDDDQNGFVDDIHGWNFIGNSSGENINFENLEYTRVYKAGASHRDYARAKELYTAELEKRKKQRASLEEFEKNYLLSKNVIRQKVGIEVRSLKDLDAISPDAPEDVFKAKRFLASRYERGFEDRMLEELIKNNSDYFEYFLNVNFDPRKVIGDDPGVLDGPYGNPDVEGPRADHGTSVAGIIAAKRKNGIGIDGIAQDVRIMCIRSTPRGDERDKDVANAIRYAVDNGARIINMSFGKDLSPEKHLVDDAVKYAEQRNVLLVHGSGNAGKNIDREESYPSDRYLNGTEALNWINVGASGPIDDETLPAVFSNYGEKHVDIFAPGVNIISLDSSGTYNMHDGTSLAAPVVSGVAALILSYYPDLTPVQLIDLLILTSTKFEKTRVLEPGFGDERKKTKMKDLSKSGGVVNAYEALNKADQLYGTR